MYFVEEPEITGNCFGEVAVGSGRERDAAPSGFFALEKIKNLLPIGKASGVGPDSRREFVFEGGSSRKQPERKQEERAGAGFEEDEDALPEDVASDQSAVEIDA